MKTLFIASLLGLLLLSSCAPATPASTPEPITIQYTAVAQPWLPAVYGCASRGVVNSELRSADYLDLTQADMTIRFGETPNQTAPSYRIGTDNIIVIANRQNPVKQLSLEQVRRLFSGQLQNWKDINGVDAPVQVWVFASSEDVQQIFEQTSLGGIPITSEARLATSPDEMAQAIANDINGVGILTGHWKADNVSDLFEAVADVPVLATTRSEPKGAILQLIICLQK